MVALKAIFILTLPCISSAFLFRRDSATINKDLMTIDADVRNSTTAANIAGKSNLTVYQGIYLYTNLSKIDKDTQQATKDVQSTPPLTSAACSSSVTYINTTLEPDVKVLNNALIAKKSQLYYVGLQEATCDQLKAIKNDTDTFATNLYNICPANLRPAVSAAQVKLDADYNSGISAFC